MVRATQLCNGDLVRPLKLEVGGAAATRQCILLTIDMVTCMAAPVRAASDRAWLTDTAGV